LNIRQTNRRRERNTFTESFNPEPQATAFTDILTCGSGSNKSVDFAVERISPLTWGRCGFFDNAESTTPEYVMIPGQSDRDCKRTVGTCGGIE
jgi:hypothetical protein